MPYDGFLFGSRKEAHTSPSVKGLIVAAAGVDDLQWEGTYVKDTGGIIIALRAMGACLTTVLSGLGIGTMKPCSTSSQDTGADGTLMQR